MDQVDLIEGSDEPVDVTAEMREASRARTHVLKWIAGILAGILVLAMFYTMYFARDVLLPLVMAILLSFLLSPMIRWMAKRRIPPAIGATFIMAIFLGSLGFGIYNLADPAIEYLEELPTTARRLAERTQDMQQTVQKVQRAAEEAEEIAAAPTQKKPTQVQVQETSFGDLVLSATWQTTLAALIVFALLFFLLAAEDLFLEKLVTAMPTVTDKKRAVAVVRKIEGHVGSYLLAYLINNTILAAAVYLALWWLGMPTPLLFAIMVGLLNFIPYAGAVASAIVIGLAAAAHFDTTAQVFAPPLVFLVLTTLEGTLLQPIIVGSRMALNPVAVFVSLIFWAWLWGVPGSLMAIPILAVFKAVFEEIPMLQPVASFFGR